MIEIVCEFIVKDHTRGQFELVFGKGGAWSTLFTRSPGFRGTTLLRDTNNPRRYLAIDVWDSAEHHDNALAEHQTEYADLLASFADWTDSRVELGMFRIQAEATVRPSGKKRGKENYPA
jgi:heme-degrading monooxygenase HmoA